MVALYALVLLAPTAAFAFSNSPAAAHCLTLPADHHRAAAAQSHHHDHAAMAHEDTNHAQPTAADDKDHATPGECCGLFCLSALTPLSFGVTETRFIATAQIAMPPATSLLGRGSGRIDRPPRSLSAI